MPLRGTFSKFHVSIRFRAAENKFFLAARSTSLDLLAIENNRAASRHEYAFTNKFVPLRGTSLDLLTIKNNRAASRHERRIIVPLRGTKFSLYPETAQTVLRHLGPWIVDNIIDDSSK